MTKIMTILGTRPEIIKMCRVIAELDEHVDHILVHSGQNYDYELNEVFFNDLGVRKPDYFLDVGCGSGDLVYMSKPYTQNSVGIDFAEKMITIAKKKFCKNKNNNLEFYSKSIFEFRTSKKTRVLKK